jgi:hypothetical protein
MPATRPDTVADRLKPVVRAVVAGYLAVALIGALQLVIGVQSTVDGAEEYAIASNSGSPAGDRLLP